MPHIDDRIAHYIQSMPIGRIERAGDWSEPQSFSDPLDFKRATRDSFLERVKTSFNKTPFDFDIFLVNIDHYTPEDHQEIGEVDAYWLRKKLPEAIKAIGITDNKPWKKPNTITVLFTNNNGTDKFPLSPWIIAHRISHGLTVRNWSINKLAGELECNAAQLIMQRYTLVDYTHSSKVSYLLARNIAFEEFLPQVCQFKSIRTKSIRKARISELSHELVAQYILKGKIEFNKLPKFLDSDGFHHALVLNKAVVRTSHDTMAATARSMNKAIEQSLTNARGKIFVI